LLSLAASLNRQEFFTGVSRPPVTFAKRTEEDVMKRPEINITSSERAGRIVIGAAAATIGVVLLASAGGALAVALEALLVLAGLDLVVTGALGHCPLYRKLGHMPASLQRPA
jgi:Protein of unknown function (DUF2892)